MANLGKEYRPGLPQRMNIDTDITKKPIQARALKTQQDLLDAFETLLTQKSFLEMTVAELAQAANLTTGAIYRRFKSKNDVLHSAFERFYERAEAFYVAQDQAYPDTMSDRDVLETFFNGVMHNTLENIHLMRAANSLNDEKSFRLMISARDIAAGWLAGRLRSSAYEHDELLGKCRFIVRIATATFRDTFLSGRQAVTKRKGYVAAHKQELTALNEELVGMAFEFLHLSPDLPTDGKPARKG